jgi:hypothetical protein
MLARTHFAVLGGFVVSAGETMTARAIANVPVDWQVEVAPGADVAAVWCFDPIQTFEEGFTGVARAYDDSQVQPKFRVRNSRYARSGAPTHRWLRPSSRTVRSVLDELGVSESPHRGR